MALGDGIRYNIASVDPSERAMLRDVLISTGLPGRMRSNAILSNVRRVLFSADETGACRPGSDIRRGSCNGPSSPPSSRSSVDARIRQ